MKERIAKLAKAMMNSCLTEKIISGAFDQVISIDVESFVKRFNKGEVSVLEDPVLLPFLDSDHIAHSFLFAEQISSRLIGEILLAKELLSYRGNVHSLIQEKKNTMTYDSSETFVDSRRSDYKDVTYAYVVCAMDLAKQLFEGDKVYKVLRFFMKYESLIGEMRDRRTMLKKKDQTSHAKEKFIELLHEKDDDMGIVRVDNNGSVSVHAGTKRDMAISDIIGKPFEKDADEPGYDYGPHGDYYMPPKKVTKTFHTEDLTDFHKKLIRNKKIQLAYLPLTATSEMGYIETDSFAILITRRELVEAGYKPEDLGWKPLRLEVQPRSVSKVCKDWSMDLTVREKLGVKKQLLTKGRK